MSRFPHLIVVATSLLSLSCGLVFSLDGYAGVADGGSTGGGPDGGAVEGGVADGGVLEGGGSCPAGALFCDDFERDAVKGRWDSFGSSGGTIEIGTRPEGRVLAAHLVPAGGPGIAGIDVAKRLPAITKKVSYRSIVTMTAAPGAGPIHLNKITFFLDGTGQNYAAVFPLATSAGTVTLSELRCGVTDGGGCDYEQSQSVQFELGKRHELTLEVDFATQPATLRLKLDKSTVVEENAQSAVAPGVLEVRAGIVYSEDPTHDVTLDVDDVVVTGE